MSFDLGFYKGQVLNKVGEYKDRASATLKALDNCEVNLKVTTAATKDEKMPSSRFYKIRDRSKSKCKHTYTHETVRNYNPSRRPHSPDWAYDSDSDCSCDECDPCGCGMCTGRGRSPYRLPIYGDREVGRLQQNINQQNINVLPGCHGSGGHRHGNRSRSRGQPVIVLPTRSHRRTHHIEHATRHQDGPCCMHGYGPLTICPQGCHGPRQHHLMMARNGYTPITNDDGKVDIYNNAKLLKSLADFADVHAKEKKERENARSKKQDDTADMINKLLKPAPSTPAWMWPGECERSAEDIRSELERVNSDMDQLHSWASMIAADAAALNEAEVRMDQLAMCTGALQHNENKEDVQAGKRRVSKPALARPKKMDFLESC